MLQSAFAFIRYPLFTATVLAGGLPRGGVLCARSKQPGCGSGMRLKTAALLAATLMCATPRLIAAERGHILDVVDRVPKFETFYGDAKGLGEGARWSLWKKEYGIAAVPPTAQGEALARTQLDAAWPRYAALIPRLKTLEAAAEKEIGRASCRERL